MVAGEVLYPSQGLFYFKLADPATLAASGPGDTLLR
jgi:hypothetical protein